MGYSYPNSKFNSSHITTRISEFFRKAGRAEYSFAIITTAPTPAKNMKKEDLQSFANTHEKPFLVIDRNSRIAAANGPFLQAYKTTLSEVLDQPCYKVTHGNERPCHEMGEECPLKTALETGEAHSCLHIHAHYDQGEHVHHVRVKGYPMTLSSGEFYMAEIMEEIAVRNAQEDADCLVGSCQTFLSALEAMQLAAKSSAPVLIQGETGTGKELAAKFIHQHSSRAKGPLLTLDCTVLTETLVESELFGHERGAFTGSVGDRQGLFKLADGGTLFLDEIGELAKPLQSKLLRVLESGEFRRVGGSTTLRSDVRIICATNRNLAQEVARGDFREDLYYRMNCLTVELPPLRRRREDIPELATMLLKRIQRPGQQLFKVTGEALELLQDYDFPGNIRELKNILHAASALAIGSVIDQQPIRKLISDRSSGAATPASPSHSTETDVGNATRSLKEVEKNHLMRLLKRYHGSRSAIAKALGISERTVYRKLNRYGLR